MFRFTIRDVLWLTVVVALAVGWWTSRRDANYARFALREEKARNDAITELNKTMRGVEFTQVPLKDVATYISQSHNIPVVLSSRVNGASPVTGTFRDASLRSCLEEVLAAHDLDFRVKEGSIMIEPKNQP